MKAILAILVMLTLPLCGAAAVLEWDRNPEPEVIGYRVQWGTQSGSYSLTKDAGNETNVMVDGLAVGTTYYFVVIAYDAEGVESQPSNEVSWTPPPTPITLAYDGKERELTWTDSRTPPEPPLLPFLYRVERADVADVWQAAGAIEGSKLNVEELQPGTYWFRVFAVSRVGGADSEPSNVVKVTILKAPGGLRRIAVEASSDLQNWTPVATIFVPEAEDAERTFYRLAFQR